MFILSDIHQWSINANGVVEEGVKVGRMLMSKTKIPVDHVLFSLTNLSDSLSNINGKKMPVNFFVSECSNIYVRSRFNRIN